MEIYLIVVILVSAILLITYYINWYLNYIDSTTTEEDSYDSIRR